MSQYNLKPVEGSTFQSKPYAIFENEILWNSVSVGKFPKPEVSTAFEVFRNVAQKFPSKRAFGQRELIKREWVDDPVEKGQKREILYLGDYSWITFSQAAQRVQNFGAGMMKFASLQPKDRVLIYAETQRDWLTAAFACFGHNLTVVTAYSTLGVEAAAFAINLTKSKVIISDTKMLPLLLTIIKKCPTVKTLVTLSESDPEVEKKIKTFGVNVSHFEEIIVLGEQNPLQYTEPTPDDLALIMFTSGTTGNPKGVMISHSNIVSSANGIITQFGVYTNSSDILLSYLPLAHVMELSATFGLLSLGISIGFGNPNTLTTNGTKLGPGQSGDLVLLRPTVIVFAPLILERIYSAIKTQVSKSPKLSQFLFKKALEAGYKNLEHGHFKAPDFWNKLIFNKIRMFTGGSLRAIVSGAAPLNREVQRFLQVVLSCPVRQGYGLTETCGATTCQQFNDNSTGTVGPPLSNACLKLVDWEEGGYRVSDKNNPEIGVPRGEIVLGGDVVTMGYYTDPGNIDPEIEQKNKTEYKVDENGIRWFYTGDIGQVNQDGNIQIIDRKKDLVKLQHGEYLAPSKIESVLKLSPYIQNAFVYAESSETYAIVLVCPRFDILSRVCSNRGIYVSLDELCENQFAKEEVLKSCNDISKGKLANFEIPKKIILVPASKTWTPENNLLTNAMKLKRKQIYNFHEQEIRALYSK